MSDEYFNEKPGRALRSWALYQMLAGAGWGALFVAVIGAFLLGLWGISMLLPPESKEAPPPMGNLTIEAPVLTDLA
ncbi:MAG: hypothetical protein RIR62_1492 [Pseudomonadota bacterium]|jgi:hypothetical protein